MTTIYKYPNHFLYLNIGAVVLLIYTVLTNELDTLGKFFLVVFLIVFSMRVITSFKNRNDGIYRNQNELLLIVKGETQTIKLAEIEAVEFEVERNLISSDIERRGAFIVPKITLKNGQIVTARFNLNTNDQNKLIMSLRD